MRFQQYIQKDKPTLEMEEFFNERTKTHIQRVKNNIQKICEIYPNTGEINKEDLEQRASTHDVSKWSPEEYIPSIWFTWKRKLEQEGKSFEIPSEMKEKINEAWIHHYTHNDHHPEYFCEPHTRTSPILVNNMGKQQMIEMVCDLGAMSQEFNNSLLKWINDVTFKKYHFDDLHKMFILKIAKLIGE